jgi:hypothetical protein
MPCSLSMWCAGTHASPTCTCICRPRRLTQATEWVGRRAGRGLRTAVVYIRRRMRREMRAIQWWTSCGVRDTYTWYAGAGIDRWGGRAWVCVVAAAWEPRA